jgi:DNA-binding NarL/FixJ family response regulator
MLMSLNARLSETSPRPVPNPARASGQPVAIKKRVFLVEDHPLMRRSIAEAIEREPDLTVCGHAEDAATALATILSLPPDIVLTDIRLKSSSGLDLIQTLRARLPALSIVATTMFDAKQIERLARAAGASAFVSKENGPDNMIAVLRGVLEAGGRDGTGG